MQVYIILESLYNTYVTCAAKMRPMQSIFLENRHFVPILRNGHITVILDYGHVSMWTSGVRQTTSKHIVSELVC